MSDPNARWRALVDRWVVELVGRYVAQLDATWIVEPAIEGDPEFPDGLVPHDDYELLERRVSRTVLWKDADGDYHRREVVRRIYELKPEVIR